MPNRKSIPQPGNPINERLIQAHQKLVEENDIKTLQDDVVKTIVALATHAGQRQMAGMHIHEFDTLYKIYQYFGAVR